MGKDFAGTTTNLWAIAAAVYMSLMGPAGFREIGEVILRRSAYAAAKIGSIPGVKSPAHGSHFFKEFVVDWESAGKSAAAINEELKRRGFLGGIDLSSDLPVLGEASLFCVTEIHRQSDIDELAEVIEQAVVA